MTKTFHNGTPLDHKQPMQGKETMMEMTNVPGSNPSGMASTISAHHTSGEKTSTPNQTNVDVDMTNEYIGSYTSS